MKNLECLRETVSGKDRKNIDELLASSNNLMDTVKHAIILLQMARNKVEVPATDLAQIRLSTTTMQQQQGDDKVSQFGVLYIVSVKRSESVRMFKK